MQPISAIILTVYLLVLPIIFRFILLPIVAKRYQLLNSKGSRSKVLGWSLNIAAPIFIFVIFILYFVLLQDLNVDRLLRFILVIGFPIYVFVLYWRVFRIEKKSKL